MMRQTQQPQQGMEQPSKIFLNPKFAKAHINPKFLAKQETLRPEELPQNVPQPQTTIHVNPAFLEKLRTQQVPAGAPATGATPFSSSVPAASHSLAIRTLPHTPCGVATKTSYGPANPIIKNTKRKLIRAATASPVVSPSKQPSHQLPELAPMVKIGKNKLIRSTVPSMMVGLENVKPTTVNVLPQRRSLKIDRRLPKAMLRDVLPAKPTFVKRYALSRIDGLTTRRVVITDPKLLKLKRKTATKSLNEPGSSKATIAYASKNKKLVLVNINGVLYRSSTNKLQKSIPTARPAAAQTVRKGAKEQVLVIRGTRFALDRTGMRLRTIAGAGDGERKLGGSIRAPEPHRMHRIDIGGLTYKARKDGTFVRTDVHRTRNHLSVAKQRSIQVLTSRLRKCNEPCHIYRRLGRCLAHSRGKCPKLHDPKHISICRKFLSGECTVEGCLLSHNVTLEKMPVCRFFLEGRCVRDVCPYLHKKVSEKERICDAFLNGFCPLADKCPNRHVFQCPGFERNGRCERIKCPYPHGRKETKPKPTSPRTAPVDSDSDARKLETTEVPATIAPVRYYREDATGETGELSVSDRKQLTRMLGAVDKMKKQHGEDAGCVSIQTDAATPREAVASPDESPEQSIEGEACAGEEETEEDTRPPVLRRKKLGTLPSFIPI
ncbi:zinc finger CCCH domain-containing protein 3 [Anopheles aquasalis]|uniref:zinc finger CCCH domain-containing protein 3 n=1 Tax=Anopheles aquasalis TaxID=42839 RepID=UPI00215A488B|nr:zinc finger CCCH domain-containing protein 3 [Anopheles aquasalis]